MLDLLAVVKKVEKPHDVVLILYKLARNIDIRLQMTIHNLLAFVYSDITYKLPKPELLEQRIRLCHTFHRCGLHLAGLLVHIRTALIRTVIYQRLLALERSLIKYYVVNKQICEVVRGYRLSVSIVALVKFLDTCRIKCSVIQLGYESFLRIQNPL